MSRAATESFHLQRMSPVRVTGKMERPRVNRTHTGWKRQTTWRQSGGVADTSIPRPPGRRPRRLAWRAQRMNYTPKVCLAAAVFVVMVSVACSPAAVAPSPSLARSPAGSPSTLLSPSPAPSSSQGTRLTVAGTEVQGSALQLTVDLPPDWQSFTYGASRGTSAPPAGMAFVVSLVDNTFKDPCAHVQRTPKVGPTVEALAAALREIPNATATAPVQTTIAGHVATYVEIAIPGSLPCAPNKFYLWQDSPSGDWWVQGLNETARVWILNVGGKRVAFLAHSYSGSSTDAKAEVQKILDTVVFDTTAGQTSPTPGMS